MSSMSQGQALRLRSKSRLVSNRIGHVTPEFLVAYRSVAAPGAVGIRLFTAPSRCRVVAVDESHTTAGAGASVIDVRKHLEAHDAAPSAALSGANITAVAVIAADADVNVTQDGDLTVANATLEAGDKLMLVTPATLAGVLVQVWLVWL
jgi:hypothetical protein